MTPQQALQDYVDEVGSCNAVGNKIDISGSVVNRALNGDSQFGIVLVECLAKEVVYFQIHRTRLIALARQRHKVCQVNARTMETRAVGFRRAFESRARLGCGQHY